MSSPSKPTKPSEAEASAPKEVTLLDAAERPIKVGDRVAAVYQSRLVLGEVVSIYCGTFSSAVGVRFHPMGSPAEITPKNVVVLPAKPRKG